MNHHQKRVQDPSPVVRLALTTERAPVVGTYLRLTFVHADESLRLGAAVRTVERVTGQLHRFPGAVVTVDGVVVAP